MTEHERFMAEALKLAKKAAKRDEVPVGAVVVKNGKIIARAYNLREHRADPSAHAELLAMRRAARKIGRWRLDDCTLYVTLEPCVMCAGCIINSRIPNVVFGAYDMRFGGMGSVYDMNEGKLNHTVSLTGGIMKEECAAVLSEYFKGKRKKK